MKTINKIKKVIMDNDMNNVEYNFDNFTSNPAESVQPQKKAAGCKKNQKNSLDCLAIHKKRVY